MAGRIRTIKPEWLEDEKMVLASSGARVLSIALILEADDYGNGRANETLMMARIFPADPRGNSGALQELRDMGFLGLYEVRGQEYFTIHNWEKHQKVSKPGKPRVPPPSEASPESPKIPRGFLGSPRPDHDHIPTTNDHDLDPYPDHDQRNTEQAVTEQAASRESPSDGHPPEGIADEVGGADILQQATDVLMKLNELTGLQYPFTSLEMVKDIARRLRGEEGEPMATVADCELVIAHRVARWTGTDQAEFLRPKTLFAKKHFTGYLASARVWDSQGRPERAEPDSGHRKPSNISNEPIHPSEPSREELEKYREKGDLPF